MSGRVWMAESDPVTCDCGSTEWSTDSSYSGADHVRLLYDPALAPTDWYAPRYSLENDGRRYDEEIDGWECANGHRASDDQSERLDEIRSEAM